MRKLFLFLSLFTVLMTIHLFPGVIATFRDFKYPHRFYIEGDRIYINEGTTISIYSLKDFQMIKKFGRKGEGPKLFSRLRLKKEPPSAGISNEEQGTPNVEGKRPSGK